MSEEKAIIHSVGKDGIYWITATDEDSNTMVEVVMYVSPEDGTPVVELSTPGENPVCRIYHNDAVLHENPPYPSEGP